MRALGARMLRLRMGRAEIGKGPFEGAWEKGGRAAASNSCASVAKCRLEKKVCPLEAPSGTPQRAPAGQPCQSESGENGSLLGRAAAGWPARAPLRWLPRWTMQVPISCLAVCLDACTHMRSSVRACVRGNTSFGVSRAHGHGELCTCASVALDSGGAQRTGEKEWRGQRMDCTLILRVGLSPPAGWIPIESRAHAGRGRGSTHLLTTSHGGPRFVMCGGGRWAGVSDARACSAAAAIEESEVYGGGSIHAWMDDGRAGA